MRPRTQTAAVSKPKLPPLISRSTVTTPDSAFHSDYSPNDPSSIYTIHQSLKPDYTIIDSSGLAVYHIKTKGLLRPTSPHLTMYAGKDATAGPVVAFAKFSRNSSPSAKLVRGNPENAADAIWEDLRRVERWAWAGAGVRYRWEMAIINWDRDGDGEVVRKGFLWKRTKAFAVDGGSDASGSPGYRGHVRASSMGAMMSRSVERQSYKLVDEETGELLAVLSVDVGMGRFRRLGRMRFVTEKYGLAFKMMVFLSGLVVNSWEDL
ncbi:uncharacterized protein APUU_40207S [Aspergillus puulaauensis]|uniref:Phospholipid scramblase n=1 Tax=Aspergillus puulaauensis TaxID=1220207 RepID=A0A7R7XMU4_9EURO|nr:uncharacterized protein APUU_40207S [Aspergillus puulaauensis]BCS23763.1 hypothetical protein APUU_40207S [Aspergillus puulaauensis]